MRLPHAPLAAPAVLAVLLLLAGPGCLQTTKSGPSPVRYDETTQRQFEGEFTTLKTAYEAALKAENLPAARLARDRMIFLLRVEIDKWYARLEQELHESRATFNSWADFTELGLAGAGAIATPVDSKTIFATLLAVSKGTRLSIDKNWFREKATESLMNAMRAGRNQQLAQIIAKMSANGADRYTFEEAWGDLIAYHQAGTIPGGLVILAATTGQEAKKAEDDVKQANKPRYPELVSATPAMVAEMSQAVAKAMGLSAERKRAVLAELTQLPDDTPDDKLGELMNRFIQGLLQATAEDRRKFIETINRP